MSSINMVICWLGVCQSLLLSTYFTSAGRKSLNQVFLGAAMLMVMLRAAKSTMFLFHPEVPLWFINIGFAAHAAIGPLLLLYTQSFNPNFRFKKLYLFHFLPAILITLFSSQLQLDLFWYQGGYTSLLFYTLSYTVIYIWVFVRERQQGTFTSEVAFLWISVLLTTLTLFQFSYFSNYILRFTDYSNGPMLYSVLIYLITFVVIKNNQAFLNERKKKYQNVNLSEAELASHFQVISNIMEQQKPYRDVEFSVQKLAELTTLPGYIISTVLSSKAQTNFNQYANNYRIQDAKQMLSNPKFDHLTIAAIAYECGFNSLSSFNTAFKKLAGTTPSAFKGMRTHGHEESVTDSLKSVPNS
jgi:AraC-like DNA-binding protein